MKRILLSIVAVIASCAFAFGVNPPSRTLEGIGDDPKPTSPTGPTTPVIPNPVPPSNAPADEVISFTCFETAEHVDAILRYESGTIYSILFNMPINVDRYEVENMNTGSHCVYQVYGTVREIRVPINENGMWKISIIVSGLKYETRIAINNTSLGALVPISWFSSYNLNP